MASNASDRFVNGIILNFGLREPRESLFIHNFVHSGHHNPAQASLYQFSRRNILSSLAILLTLPQFD